jgi:acetyl esterase/lipase
VRSVRPAKHFPLTQPFHHTKLTSRCGAGVVVGAGWTSKESYGSANALFGHDISSTNTEPALMGLLRSTVHESDVDRFASNLAGLPVLVRVGELDGTVPPYWSRKMSRLLKDVGVDVKYSELPGKEHWWW